MKKIISLLLIFTFIMSCVFIIPSCKETEDDDTPTAAPVEIIKNGEAKYTIVYPDSCSDAILEEMGNLITAIRNTTGVKMEYIKASKATDPDASYILIGATGFAESAAAIDALKGNADAYTIEKAGKHIVLAGHFDTATVEALKYFTKNLITSNYDGATKTLTLREYCFDGSKAFPAAFEVQNLSKYTIVYAAKGTGNRETAEKIQQRIKMITGKTLDVSKDTGTPETAYEILVGKTNRYLSEKCYRDATYLMEYKFVVEKGQLQIVCGGLHSAKIGGYALADMLIDKTLTIPTGTHAKTNLATESIPLTSGTDVRIMTANILSYQSISGDENKTNIYPVSEERAEILAKILVDYTPDFVGVQEMDSGFHTPLLNFLDIIKETYGIEYSIILTKYSGSTNHSPIIYRSDKFTCDYQNFDIMSYAPNAANGAYGSGITSAKFTSINDPSLEIALLSAHWHWEREDAVVGAAKQSVDAVKMAEVVKYLEEQYPNAHVFSTGDFNSHRFDGRYLDLFLEKINGAIASKIATNNNVIRPSFKHQGEYIDHIIGRSGTFDVLYHAGTENASATLTDHQPVFADIKFTK